MKHPRRVVVSVGLTIVMIASTLGLDVRSAETLSGIDAWSPIVELRDAEGWYVSPVHATLMPDGSVHFTGIRRSSNPPDANTLVRRSAFVMTPDPVGAGLPGSTIVNSIAEPVEFEFAAAGGVTISDDLVCSGHTLLADGTLLMSGGTRVISVGVGPTQQLTSLGLPTQSVYRSPSSWNRVSDMVSTANLRVPYRWYPTLTRLPDGRVLIAGGYDSVAPTPLFNLSTEVYNPLTGSNTPGSPFGATPRELAASDYIHTYVLPFSDVPFDLLSFGQQGIPVLGSTNNPNSWFVQSNGIRPGASSADTMTNDGTSSVMLPIRQNNLEWGYNNGSVLMAGGGHATTFVDQADVYDPITNSWLPPIDLGVGRHHPSSVLLPDGRILLLSGHNTVGNGLVQQAQYVDPANGFSVTTGTAAAGVTRGYHSTATLLPDGRVLVTGGRDSITSTSVEKPTYQYYEPDYMSADRPAILWAPTQLGYGDPRVMFTSGGGTPAEVVLIGLGSMTHSTDMNQRSIQLPVAQVFEGSDGNDMVIFGDPLNSHVAPPGPYMLFVVDDNRIPSEGQMVMVG